MLVIAPCLFNFKGINVTLQLAAMPRPVVLLLTRCKVALSAEELMDSFEEPFKGRETVASRKPNCAIVVENADALRCSLQRYAL